MGIAVERKLNPWLSIWTRPRATIQQIVDTDPERLVPLLAGVAGISNALDRASMKNLGDKFELPSILLMAVGWGVIGGIIGLLLFAALLRWTGAWIGGKASQEQLRAAIAWSNVPVIVGLPLWVAELVLFGRELFTSETPRIDADLTLTFTLLGMGLAQLVLGVWALVVYLKCVGQVQGFSAWKAAWNTLIAAVVVVVPLLALVFGFGWLVR